MSWVTNTLSSSLGKKLLMALTGLFLVTFLIVHLTGNLQLLAGDGGLQFNAYAKFMTTNPVIKTTSYLLYATFIVHIIWAIWISVSNKKARPIGYEVSNASANSHWTSRNMGILGTIIAVFLVIHLRGYWYEMHWGDISLDTAGNKDLYAVVAKSYTQWWYVLIYLVSMAAVGFHLFHGFQSGFQTLGLNHKKYTPAIKKLGVLIAVLIPLGFAIIPIVMFINSLG